MIKLGIMYKVNGDLNDAITMRQKFQIEQIRERHGLKNTCLLSRPSVYRVVPFAMTEEQSIFGPSFQRGPPHILFHISHQPEADRLSRLNKSEF